MDLMKTNLNKKLKIKNEELRIMNEGLRIKNVY